MNPIYQFLKNNNLTQKDEKSFSDTYSDKTKVKELHTFFSTNKLTQKDFDSFYNEYFKKKEPSEVVSENGGAPSISEAPLPTGITKAKVQPVEYKEPSEGVGEDTVLGRKVKAFREPAIVSTGVKLPAAPKAVAEEKAKERALAPKLPPQPKEQGWISNVVSALDRGFYKNLIGSPVKALGTLVKYGTSAMTGGRVQEGPVSDALMKFGDYFNNAIDEIAPQDESFKNSLSDQFTQALGQVGAMALTGGLTAAPKSAIIAEEAVPAAVLKKGLAGKAATIKEAGKEFTSELASPTAVSAGLVMGQSEFDRAKQAGATDGQAFEAFYKNAAVGSILEKIPVMQFLKRFNQSTGGGVTNYLKTKGVEGIKGGLEEMTTEVLQQLYANKTAQDVYNINQSIFDGVTGAGGIGFGVGFLLNAMGAHARTLREQGKGNEAKVVDNQVKEFESRASQGVPEEPETAPAEPPQVPPTEKTYRVEYFDPKARKMTHQMFASEAEGEAFKKTLTKEQTSQGVQSYYEKPPTKVVGEVAPEVAPQVPAAEKELEAGVAKVAPTVVGQAEVSEHGKDIKTEQGLENGIKKNKLSLEGEREAIDLGQYLVDQGKTEVMSSPVERAKQTAEIAADKAGIPVRVDESLKTWDIGDFDGKPEGTFKEADFVSSPDTKVPGGESFNDFTGRMEQAYAKVEALPETSHVVAHSKVIRALEALKTTDGLWNENTTKEFLRLGEEEAAKAAPKVPATPEITDTEYTEFIDKGTVTPERLNDIAQKVKNKETLSEREQAVFTDKTAEINKILSAPEIPPTPLKPEEYAVQKPSPEGAVPRTPEERRDIGEGRERIRPSEQRPEITEEVKGKEKEVTPPPPVPPTPKEAEVAGEDLGRGRRFTAQMFRSPELLDAVKEGVAPTYKYTTQTNAMTLEEAQQVLNVLGEDKALDAMKNPDTKGAVRVVLGQVLIKRYNQLAKETTTQADKDYNINKSIEVAEYVTVKLATEAGQTIQAFSLWDKLTPEAQIVFAAKQKRKSAGRNIDKVRKDVDNINEKFDKANEEAIKEVLKSEEVSKTVKKDSQEGIQRAKDRAAKARQKRADIIKKYKGRGGVTFTTGGLTKEGIEFVGEVAVTYVQEGIAEVQVIAEKILAHIKEVSGKEPNEAIRREVFEIADKKLAASDIATVKSVKDKGLKLEKIATEYFTSKERIKKNLAQKFIDQADMSESNAQALAKRFEEAFDRVVNRKKLEILARNKKRFERIRKAINSQAAVKTEPKTLQDEIIKYSNLGAFKSEDMLEYLTNKFELGQLTKEQASKIQELAEKVQRAPEGSPKREATEDLLSYQAGLNGGNWGEVAQGIWYANILSGYRTHEKNIVSTFIQSWANLGSEIIADPKAAPYIIAGYMQGVKKRGLLEAARTLTTGRSPIHVAKIEVPEALERVRFVGGGYNPANWFKYVGRAMKAEDVLSFQGLKEARAWQLARRDAAKLGFNTWSGSGWKKVNELLFNTAERYEIAIDQAESEGFKPNTRDWKRRIYELMENNRPIEMTEDAYNFAAHGTFNYESDGVLGAFTNAVSKVLDIKVGAVQPMRFVVPFTRIITNVVNNSLDYSPIGVVRAIKGARGFKSLDEYSLTKGTYKPLTPEQRRTVLVKAAVGISFAAIIQYMAESGLIEVSGGGPEDEKKKAQLRESGWQPYSIKIGDKWYSYQLTPLVLSLGMIGNFNDAAKYNKEDERTILKRLEYSALSFGGMIADMTWINSAGTFLGAFTEPKIADQQRKVEQALGSMARGFVPFSQFISQTTQAYNNIFQVPAKQVNNSFEALYQDFPIARNSLNNKINALGEPVVKDIDIMVSKEKADPVWQFLSRKQGWVAPLSKKTVFVFDDKLQQDRPLNGDEFYKLSIERGKIIKENIKRVMSEGYPVMRNDQITNVMGEDLTPAELNNILSKRIEPMATKEAKAKIFGISYSEMDQQDLKKELTELEKEYWGLNDD